VIPRLRSGERRRSEEDERRDDRTWNPARHQAAAFRHQAPISARPTMTPFAASA
jgi:hypothetical protein